MELNLDGVTSKHAQDAIYEMIFPGTDYRAGTE
jgi:hypothetical protein